MLVMDGSAAVAAHTIDIGNGGVAALVDGKLALGSKGRIMFEMLVEGKLHLIDGRVAVTHCILGHEGFKVGFQFAALDTAVANAIAKYMR
jgi:c-di-GMP-binding flagellar brake protein YcgR